MRAQRLGETDSVYLLQIRSCFQRFCSEIKFLYKMTVKNTYDLLMTGVGRRSKQLEDLMKDPGKVDRTVRIKVKELELDKEKIIKAATDYVDSLSSEKDNDAIEKVYEDQMVMLDAVDQALEKAREFLSEEDHKLEILEKVNKTNEKVKEIKRDLTKIEKKVKEYDSTKLMPVSVYETLEGELTSVKADIEEAKENYIYLVTTNAAKKDEYEGKLEELNSHKEQILDLKLSLGSKVERAAVEQKPASVDIKSVPVMPSIGWPQFQTPPPQSAGYKMPVLSSPVASVPPSGQLASVSPPPVNPSASVPRIQMQKLKAPVFEGDVCTYAGWKKEWREMVHPNCSGETEELYRMKDAMGTKSLKQVLKSFQTLRDAWSYMDDKFGRADIAAVKMIAEFKSMDMGRVSDHEKFMEMHDKFKNLAINLNEIGQLNSLNSLTEVNMMVSMLPGEIKTKFAEFKSGNLHLVGYSLLAAFMDYQVLISRECVVAIQAVGGFGYSGGKVTTKKDVKCYKCQEDGHYAKDCGQNQKSGSIPKGLLKLNGLSTKPINCPLCAEPHKVTEGKNLGKYKTRLSSCEKFRNMSTNERGGAMETAQACVKCTDWTHNKVGCDAKFGNKPWQSCSVKDSSGQNCSQGHHNLLHGSTHKYICMLLGARRAEEIVPEIEETEGVKPDDLWQMWMVVKY